MKAFITLILCLFALPLMAAETPVVSDDAMPATCPQELTADTSTPEPDGAKGGGKPGGSACCDPDLEPGTGGNPLCFEGHTCCDDGGWSCNNPDGTPSCTQGDVCDGTCGSRGDSCASGADCCSGKCKGNGTCR